MAYFTPEPWVLVYVPQAPPHLAVAEPVRPLLGVLQGWPALTQVFGQAHAPEVLGHPAQFDVVVGGDYAVIQAGTSLNTA
jgi:hypothetical protein